MRTIRRVLSILVLLAISVGGVFAATDSDFHVVTINIAEVVMIATVGGNITLSTTAPGTAGDPVAGDTDSTTAVAYTTINGGADRVIQAGITAGTVPAGTKLTLSVVDPADSGGDGLAAATIDPLSAVDTDLITAIGSTSTGTAGFALTYTLVITDENLLVVNTPLGADITVTFTLGDSV